MADQENNAGTPEQLVEASAPDQQATEKEKKFSWKKLDERLKKFGEGVIKKVQALVKVELKKTEQKLGTQIETQASIADHRHEEFCNLRDKVGELEELVKNLQAAQTTMVEQAKAAQTVDIEALKKEFEGKIFQAKQEKLESASAINGQLTELTKTFQQIMEKLEKLGKVPQEVEKQVSDCRQEYQGLILQLDNKLGEKIQKLSEELAETKQTFDSGQQTLDQLRKSMNSIIEQKVNEKLTVVETMIAEQKKGREEVSAEFQAAQTEIQASCQAISQQVAVTKQELTNTAGVMASEMQNFRTEITGLCQTNSADIATKKQEIDQRMAGFQAKVEGKLANFDQKLAEIQNKALADLRQDTEKKITDLTSTAQEAFARTEEVLTAVSQAVETLSGQTVHWGQTVLVRDQ